MSDTMKEYIAEAEEDLLHTYNRESLSLRWAIRTSPITMH